jgi:hypothetical protein
MNDSSRIIQEIVKQQGEIQANVTNILSGDFKVLILPFTAHVTIPEGYRQKYDFKEPIDAIEASVRLWATNLALSFLKECDERSKDDHFNLYTKLLNLTGQREPEELYRNFPKCSNLIYLETVIFGLASQPS